MAAGSPGEQGVRRSSTVTWLLLRDGPRTCREERRDGTRPNAFVAFPAPPLAHLFEVRGRLDLPDGLHEGVPHDDADVGARVAVGFVGELPQVGVAQAVRGVAQVEAEHLRSRRLLRQRDVDALLEP